MFTNQNLMPPGLTEEMKRNIVLILIGAAELVADASRWCQKTEAMDKIGGQTGFNANSCDPEHRDAVCWCATGAIRRVGYALFPWAGARSRLINDAIRVADHHVAKTTGNQHDMVSFNDRRGQTPGKVAAKLRGASRRVG